MCLYRRHSISYLWLFTFRVIFIWKLCIVDWLSIVAISDNKKLCYQTWFKFTFAVFWIFCIIFAFSGPILCYQSIEITVLLLCLCLCLFSWLCRLLRSYGEYFRDFLRNFAASKGYWGLIPGLLRTYFRPTESLFQVYYEPIQGLLRAYFRSIMSLSKAYWEPIPGILRAYSTSIESLFKVFWEPIPGLLTVYSRTIESLFKVYYRPIQEIIKAYA